MEEYENELKENESLNDNIEEVKEIEVVSGDGSELVISPVTEHLTSMRPKGKDENPKKNIVIPKVEEKQADEN